MEFVVENEETHISPTITGPDVEVKFLRIEGWAGFTDEQKEACLKELRRRQESHPVDAPTLEEKLKALAAAPEKTNDFSRRSPTSSLSEGIPWADEEVNKEKERESYHALLSDGGRPFQSLERQTKTPTSQEAADLMDYWNSVAKDGWVFTAQLDEWQGFRQFQQRARSPRCWQSYLSEVQKRCRTFRLEGDVTLDKDPELQSNLTTWLEYQESRHRVHEQLQQELDSKEKVLAAALTELGEDNIPKELSANNRIDYTAFGFQLAWADRITKAKFMVKLAKVKVAYARERLVTALKYPNAPIKLPAWFIREVQRLQNKARASKKHYDTVTKNEHHYYLDELEQAEKDLEKALSSPEKKIEKHVWTRRLQGALDARLGELKDCKAEHQHLHLCCRFIAARGNKDMAEGKLKRHRVLLGWIEQQRLILVSDSRVSCCNNQQDRKTTDGNGQRKLRSGVVAGRTPSQGLPLDDDSEREQGETHAENDDDSNGRNLRSRSALKRPLEAHANLDTCPAKRPRLIRNTLSNKTDVSRQSNPKSNVRISRQVGMKLRRNPRRAQRGLK